MAVQQPLVLIAGQIQQLPAGDTVAGASGGGGGATIASGLCLLDFGTGAGTDFASVTVTGQTSTALSSHIVVSIASASQTASHNYYEHNIVPIRFSVGSIQSGTGFAVNATVDFRVTGTFYARYSIIN